MAAITPQMVKELREKTDAGMLECKKALAACDGNMDAAVDFLRKAGIAKSEKRTDRVTKEGKVFAVSNGNASVMLEILCETDFVASNEKFYAFIEEAGKNLLVQTSGDGDITAKAQEIEGEDLTALFTKFGEKMVLRRAVRYETAGKIGIYLHGGGKVGVMIDVEGTDDEELIKNICLHIAAFSPAYIKPADVPAEAIEHEKSIAKAQLEGEGKPANIIEKILIGKINKWYSDICLMNQPWIHDDKSSLAKLFPKVVVKRFARWAVGQEL